MAEAGIPLPSNWYRISYFHCSLLGYFLGLLTATISSEVSISPFHSLSSFIQ
jgi:signal peptide peptidase-like protein 3